MSSTGFGSFWVADGERGLGVQLDMDFRLGRQAFPPQLRQRRGRESVCGGGGVRSCTLHLPGGWLAGEGGREDRHLSVAVQRPLKQAGVSEEKGDSGGQGLVMG